MKGPDCKNDRRGLDYSGTTSVTKFGQTCQRWDKQTPHKHHLKGGNLKENYCRNPDNEPGGPWCFTIMKESRWQYCDIPICGKDFKCLDVYLLKASAHLY